MIDASCRVRAALYLSRRHRTASRCKSRQESPVSWTGSPPVEHQLRLVHPSMEIREVPRIRFLQPPHPQPPPPPLSSPVRSALRPRRIRPRHGGTTVVIASPGCQRSAAQLASKADTSGREHLASQLTCALPSPWGKRQPPLAIGPRLPEPRRHVPRGDAKRPPTANAVHVHPA